MISLEQLIGILVFFIVNIIFFRQFFIIFKNKISNGFLFISVILFLIQIFFIVSSAFEYYGLPKEEFSSDGYYKVAVFSYYIGSHIYEIIAIIINQIVIKYENKKKTKEKENI